LGSYAVFDHTADVGLEVRGNSLPDLLATAARATFEQMIEDWPDVIEAEEDVRVVPPKGLEGDLSELLVDWLQELLFTFETRRLVPLRYEFDQVGPREVRATVGFGLFRPDRHRARLEIKAVTYHELDMHQDSDGAWRARFILDV
jgi:SHS2 domain-containing protein